MSTDSTLDPSVAARILCEKCRIRDFRYQQEAALILTDEVTLSEEPLETVLNRMITQWENYKANIGDFKWSYGDPRKFFSSAIWQDENLWPWDVEKIRLRNRARY